MSRKREHWAEGKRNEEKQKGDRDAKVLLDGMLAKYRLLDLVENFILFDDSKPGGTRKIVARNHQVLGVNNAVASVIRQEELKKRYPEEQRLVPYYPKPSELVEDTETRVADTSHLLEVP